MLCCAVACSYCALFHHHHHHRQAKLTSAHEALDRDVHVTKTALANSERARGELMAK